MIEEHIKRNTHLGVGLFICLSFLFGTTGFLSWSQNLRNLAEPSLVDYVSMAFTYLAQAAGVGAYMLAVRKAGGKQLRPLVFAAMVLLVVTIVPATLLANLPLVIAFGLLANLFIGVIQGFYALILCLLVDRDRRGTVFGCAYGVSTLLTWLLSLLGDGALTTGAPSVVCCCVMAVCTAMLMHRLPDEPQSYGSAKESAKPPEISASNTGTFAIMCVAIVLACLVNNACFAFPASDLDLLANLELVRILYGVGLVIVGVASDKNRRIALGACSISLVMPFCLLALSGADAPATVLWLLGYLLSSIYALFSILLASDYAEDVGRPYLACLGMMLRQVGLSLGSALSLALASKLQVLIGVTAVLLVVTAAIFYLLDQRLFQHKVEVAVESPEELERKRFERFSAAYGLSAREREVLPQLISGKTNAEIATDLFVTERTVKFHVHNIMKKTGCANRLEVTDLFNASAEQ